MNSFIKFLLFSIVLILSTQITRAQDSDKTISITVSGSGKTQDEAKQSALRSAIEQSFGAFISSKTEILNDQLVTDQITSVTNGNIQSFSILNESQLPDGSWAVTLKVIVSISKLTNFVESKGVAIEIKGSLFALNIKQELLNEEAEKNVIFELVSLLHKNLQKSFDYEIKSSTPKSIDNSNEYFEFPIEVSVIANKNIDFCEDYFIKTLIAISLTKEEIKNYQSLNKKVYPINYRSKIFYLRKEVSVNDLLIINKWQYYTRLFTIKSGELEITNGLNSESTGIINTFWDGDRGLYGPSRSYDPFFFPKAGKIACKFYLKEKLSLKQIEQMTEFKVNPMTIGLIEINHGGFILYEKNGHGLVASIRNIRGGEEVIKKSLEGFTYNNLNLNGFSDWRLPSEEEYDLITSLKRSRNHLFQYPAGETDLYFSYDKFDKPYFYSFYDKNHQETRFDSIYAIPVRSF